MKLALVIVIAGCYTAPEPDCGFVCGPAAVCPDDYTCGVDHYCHLDGAPASLTCTNGSAAPPMVLTIEPHNEATGVPLDIEPTATADADLFGVNESSFYMLDVTDCPVSGRVVYSNRQMRFIPDRQLVAGGFFLMDISGGVTDVNGNRLGPFGWTFTTDVVDTAPPHVRSTMPAAGAIDVPLNTNIQIVFNEPVFDVDTSGITVDANGAIAGSVASGFDQSTYQFVPAVNLPAETQVTVTIGPPIADGLGNPAAAYTFSFMTL
jgi:hypothetical protein